MTDEVRLGLSAAGGFLIGAVFFCGLWWTLRRGLASRQPVAWQLGSMVVRMGIAMGGFYVLGAGSWQRFLACGLGFLLARSVIMRWVVRLPEHAASRHHESRDASRP